MTQNERILIYVKDFNLPMGSAHSIREAYNLLQELRKEDKKYHLRNKYKCVHEVYDPETCITFLYDVKIYKRNDVYYMSLIND